MESWLPISRSSHFSLANVPFGIISTPSDSAHHVAVAIGNYALDLNLFAKEGGLAQCAGLDSRHHEVLLDTTLNRFAALGRPIHRAVRKYLQDLFSENTPYPQVLRDNSELRKQVLVPLDQVQNHLPMTVGDYTDFFAGRNHAQTVGTLFRGAANALNPNYNHVPVAYHGRASSVVVSGTALRRPKGQVLPAPGATTPTFQPSKKLDIELELGMFVAQGNELGRPITVDEADAHIFGYVLMNDWSARDIQAWEYVPLGPFNAKNFGTTISPWVVLADALDAFRTSGLPNEVQIQDYLQESRKENALDIKLEVTIKTGKGNSKVLTRTSSSNLLWSWPQMLAHHTVSGCNLRTGDLLGSGTISGLEPGTQGSLLEQTSGGKTPIDLPGNETRNFVQDDDTIIITGYAGSLENGNVVGFGDCSGTILHAT